MTVKKKSILPIVKLLFTHGGGDTSTLQNYRIKSQFITPHPLGENPLNVSEGGGANKWPDEVVECKIVGILYLPTDH